MALRYNQASDSFMGYVNFQISEDKIDNASTKILVFILTAVKNS